MAVVKRPSRTLFSVRAFFGFAALALLCCAAVRGASREDGGATVHQQPDASSINLLNLSDDECSTLSAAEFQPHLCYRDTQAGSIYVVKQSPDTKNYQLVTVSRTARQCGVRARLDASGKVHLEECYIGDEPFIVSVEHDTGARYSAEVTAVEHVDDFFRRLLVAQHTPDPLLRTQISQTTKVFNGSDLFLLEKKVVSGALVEFWSKRPFNIFFRDDVDAVVKRNADGSSSFLQRVVMFSDKSRAVVWADEWVNSVELFLESPYGVCAAAISSTVDQCAFYDDVVSHPGFSGGVAPGTLKIGANDLNGETYCLAGSVVMQSELLEVWSRPSAGSDLTVTVWLVTRTPAVRPYLESLTLGKDGVPRLSWTAEPITYSSLVVERDTTRYVAELSLQARLLFYINPVSPTNFFAALQSRATPVQKTFNKVAYNLLDQFTQYGLWSRAASVASGASTNTVHLVTRSRTNGMDFLTQATRYENGSVINTWAEQPASSQTVFGFTTKDGKYMVKTVAYDAVKEYINLSGSSHDDAHETDRPSTPTETITDRPSSPAEKTITDRPSSPAEKTITDRPSSPAEKTITDRPSSPAEKTITDRPSSPAETITDRPSSPAETIAAERNPLAAISARTLWVAPEYRAGQLSDAQAEKLHSVLGLTDAKQRDLALVLVPWAKGVSSSDYAAAVEKMIGRTTEERTQWCEGTTSANETRLPRGTCVTECANIVRDATTLFAKNVEPEYAPCKFGRAFQAGFLWYLGLASLALVPIRAAE